MKLIVLTLLVCIGVAYAYGEQINESEAKQIAQDFFAARGAAIESDVAPMSLRADESVAPYYIFNAEGNKGFVIVSGNSLTEQILGYTDNGSYDEATIPDNMRSWLQYYADELAWMEANEEAILAARQESVRTYATRTRHSIAPLLTCTWNQGDPYNAACPIYYNEDGSTGISATGCIATALVQTMYFYKYPAETKAAIPSHTLTYSTVSGTKTVTLPAIPAGTKLDWDNMLDNYDGDYTEAQKEAVANLNLYVGQAVKMGYGASSGSSYWNAEEMFEDYFGYDDAVYVARSTNFDIDEWFDMIYSEVEAGYPVAYGGTSTYGGHAFVLDGFDGEGLFHVNWGWGGGSNGYFRLTVLNSGDTSSSLTSSANGFTMGQDAILNLRSEDDGVVDTRNLNLEVASTGITNNRIRAVYTNSTGSTNSYECAIVMRDTYGDYSPVGEIITTEDWKNNSSKSLVFDLAGCFAKEGTYRLSPASRVVGTDKWWSYWTMNNDYYLATVDEDLNVTITRHTSETDVIVSDWSFVGNMAVDTEQSLIVTFANNGDEYLKEVSLYASTTSSMGSSRSRALIGVKSGGTCTCDFFFTPDVTGTWNLWLTDDERTLGSTTVDIVSAANAKKADLALNSISISNGCYGNRLTGEITVKNNGSDAYSGNVRVQLWNFNSGEGVAYSSSSSTVALTDLASGRSQTGEFDFTNLVIGQQYFISVHYTTQDGALTNGDINWSSPYTLVDGTLKWNNYGQLSGEATGSLMVVSTTTSGVLCDKYSPQTIEVGSNPNTLFAFTNGASVPSGIEGCNIVEENAAEELNLLSGYSYYSPVTFTAGRATFAHTFSSSSDDGVSGWEGLTLPFKPEGVLIDGVEATWKKGSSVGDFYLREFSYEDDEGAVIFTDVDDILSLRANTPYVIAATAETAGKTVVFYADDVVLDASGSAKSVVSTDDYLFYGSTVSVRTSGIYILNSAGDAFEYTSSTRAVNPFSAYFVTTLSDDARPEKIEIYNAAAMGIREVDNNVRTAEDNVYYDLQGRQLPHHTKGVYILNGKKYVK